jgi:FAD synthetase
MVVLVFGTFDILHAGHIHFLKSAKKLGETLTVVVARDKTVKLLKKKQSVHTEKERVTILREMRCVDAVVLGDPKLNVYAVIKKIKPDVIALGYDQIVFTDKLQEKIQEFGLNTKVVRLKAYKNGNHKSSKILKRFS